MHHQIAGSKLGRHGQHRRAMLRNLAVSLITHHQIQTTQARAKALRIFLEPLITRAKNATLADRRILLSRLGVRQKDAVHKLITQLAPFYLSRPGGYLRIIKNGFRPGDAAPRAIIQLVDMPKVTKQSAQPAEVVEGEVVTSDKV